MSESSSLKKNMVLNAILGITSMVLPMVTFPYVTRVLNPTGLGKVQFVVSVMAYFSMIASMGIQTYAVRECAKARDNRESLSRTVHELLMVNSFTMGMSYIALFIFVKLVPKAHGEELLYCIVGLGILFDCIGVEWLYSAKELFSYKTLRTIIVNTITLIVTFLIVRRPEDYLMYGVVCVLPAVGNGIVNLFNLRKHIDIKYVGNYHPTVHVKYILVFFALAAATKIYLNLDTVMLGFMQGDDQVGYYTVAVKIKTVLVSLVTSVSGVLLPRTSAYANKGNMEGLRKVITETMHIAAILSLAGALFFIGYAEETIRIIAGEEYMPALLSMQIITPAIIFIAATDIMGLQLLVPLGHENKVVASVIAGAVLDLVINIMLIPKYGAAGAAAGTLAAEAMVFIVQLYMVRKEGYRIFGDIQLPVVIVAAVAGFIASIVVKRFIAGYILSFLVARA